MSQPWDEPFPIDFPDREQIAEMEQRIIELTWEHAAAIDLLDLAMRINIRGRLTKQDVTTQRKLVRQLSETNSPVLPFIIKVLADVLCQFGADRKRVIEKMRRAAGDRLVQAEETFRAGGFQA